MKKLSFYALAIAVCCLVCSCESSKILSATFEADAINSPPAKNLPGDPSGDEIQYHDAVAPLLKVQNSGISGSKALHYTTLVINDPPPLAARYVSFKGIGTDLTETLWFTHTGQNMGSTILIFVSDGGGNSMARMRISPNGEVGLATSLNDGNYSNIIGNVGSETHTIVFTASPSTLQYNVTITKETGPAITATNKPMITTNVLQFKNPAFPMLSFLHPDNIATGNAYAIGSVLITRKEP
jgi:hypothetical protein